MNNVCAGEGKRVTFAATYRFICGWLAFIVLSALTLTEPPLWDAFIRCIPTSKIFPTSAGYADKLEKVLPARKVAKHIQIENKIRAGVKAGLAQVIPLIY